MSHSPYPSYKQSLIPWIDVLPSHWNALQLKHLFNLMKREPSDEEGVVTAFRDGEVTLRSNRRTDGFTNSEKEIGYQGVRVGDLVIHAMDAFAGAIGVSDSDGKSTPVYSVCTPMNGSAEPKYYSRALRHMALSGYVNALAKGIRERSTEFRWADASRVLLPVPPIEEQRKICSFLDHETAKIDALVKEQQRLIEMLQEKRQAVISHAVTKGIDPTVPMKDSGVEWIGHIPKHWQVDRLKWSVASSKNGVWGDDAKQDSNDIPCVRVADFDRQRLRVELDEPTIRNITPSERVGRVLVRGDLLLEKSGGGDSQPVGCVVLYDDDRPAVCSNFVARVQSAENMDSSFWRYFHAAAYFIRLNTKSIKQTSGIQNLDASQYLDEIGAFPPHLEQVQIADYLDKQTAKLDALIGEAKDAVFLFQERRTALISAAVTGKIDVRNWQKQEEKLAA